jgi:hypothetical protein
MIKKWLSAFLVSIPVLCFAQGKFPFNVYFHDQTMRVDYFHTGNAQSEEIIIDKMYIGGSWAGSPGNCIQPYDLGSYLLSLVDISSCKLMYTKGYNSIFAEYQTIEPALKGLKKTFHESVIFPLPKRSFKLTIEKRDRYQQLSTVFEQEIDPSDYHILRQKSGYDSDIIVPLVNNGDPHDKVDLVVLAEGYRSDELHKFKIDLEYFSNLLFSVEPYKTHLKDFNVNGIFSPSEESGTDETRQRIYKNTRFGSTFNYFELDRYCLADDNKSIRDVASAVPYDVILIMVNRERYGGGGIFNFQTVFTANSEHRDYVFLHELGHGFAGLGDEYFSSSVTYVDVFTPGVEPLEPNVTALPDKANVKWKKYLSAGIGVPTEWDKARYDSLEDLKMKIYSDGEIVISDLRKSGATIEKIDEARNQVKLKVDEINRVIAGFFLNHPLKDKVGVFEGASYVSKGLYRPTLKSLMHGYEKKPAYGTVNEQWIITTIRYYTGE